MSHIKSSITFDVFLIIFGLLILILGSKLFVYGAVKLAELLNISTAIIGLTIVAAGTSLPELATSLVASIKGEEDIAIGNIIGSNIFNILAILGVSSLIFPLNAEGIGNIDILLMSFLALLMLPLMRSSYKISRVEGVVLIMMYCGYTIYLWSKMTV